MSTNKKISTKNITCNTSDHKQWNRRSFLQAMGLAGGAAMTLAHSSIAASKETPLARAISNADTDRILIIVRLKGGNDGLNTIVPLYDYDTYKKARPSIAIAKNNIFKLNDNFGMPLYANALERMWGDGKMRVVHGVGYENSSLSHFKGSDNWSTCSPNTVEKTGWIGRYFEELHPDFLMNPPEKPTAILIGNSQNILFSGDDNNYAFAVGNPGKLAAIAANGEFYNFNNLPDCVHGEKVAYLKGVTNNTFSYAGVINDAYDKSNDFGDYPDNDLASQLSIIARLIKGNLGTKVYTVQLDGFDTHSQQLSTHEELITQLADTMAHFYADLENAGWDDKVLSMTISEFGRRVRQNGSGGTDHGTASPSLFFGSCLEGSGFTGTHPNLSKLNNAGNLFNTTDFRQLYSTVLEEWLCVNDSSVLNSALLGQTHEKLNLGFNCGNSLSIEEEIFKDGFSHFITYMDNQAYININNPTTAHVDISLYSIKGQKIITLENKILFEGTHIINVNTSSKTPLMKGIYIYQIIKGNKKYSKKLIL